jgi:hypothetical protein
VLALLLAKIDNRLHKNRVHKAVLRIVDSVEEDFKNIKSDQDSSIVMYKLQNKTPAANCWVDYAKIQKLAGNGFSSYDILYMIDEEIKHREYRIYNGPLHHFYSNEKNAYLFEIYV